MRLPVVAIITVYLISLVVDFYILYDIKSYVDAKRRKRWKRIYSASALLCWIFFTVTLMLPRRSTDSDIIPIMWMLYAYMSIYLSKIIYMVCSLIGRLISIIIRKHYNYLIVAGCVASAIVFFFMWFGALHTRRMIEVKYVDIDSPKIPVGFNDFKIAQISDLHVGTWGSDTTFVAQFVDSVNSLHPDIIVFTGDIVNRQTSELLPFTKVLSRLSAPYGVYSVLGNHDYGDYITWNSEAEHAANNSRLLQLEKHMGWKTLENTYEYLVSEQGDSIVLIGVENWGEPPFKQYGDLKRAYGATVASDSVSSNNGNESLTDNRFKVLLSHNPEHWEQEVKETTNIDLTLSGHTHAMQMILKLGSFEWSPSKYRYKDWSGLYESRNSKGTMSRLYVNIGSGEVGIPARFGVAYPEITLLTLRRTGDRN